MTLYQFRRAVLLLLFTTLIFTGVGFSYAAVGEEKVYYYLHDHLGGIDKVLDENGNVVCENDYLPYGESRMGDCMEDNENYGFTGQEKDTETGLYYYGARYYDPVIGRFISPDPWEGDLTDPQSLNKYAYARNNPVKYVDPTGETFMDNYIWSLGVYYFDSKGYDIAAEFLNYSVNWNQIVPFQGASEKEGLYFNTGSNDKFSQTIGSEIRSTDAYNTIMTNIKTGIESGNLNSGDRILSTSFTNADNPDLHLAINKFYYSYEASQQEDGNYNVNISITDIYDFDWVPTNTWTDVAVNMAADSQFTNAIQTYDIQIDLQETMRIEDKED